MLKIVATRKGRQRRYCSHIQYCLLVLLLPMMIFLIGAGALTTQAHTDLTLFQAPQTSIITQPETYALGETFKLGNLQYKINSVRTLGGKGNIYNSPRDGNTFLLVDLTIENQGSTDVEIRSKLGFKLEDQNGKRQKSSIGDILALKDSIGGTITAGGRMTGELVYEVSKEAKTFELTVIPNPLNSNAKIATVQILMQ